jgi:hypothetical protein
MIFRDSNDPRSFDSWEEVIDYFEARLDPMGWNRIQGYGDDPCRKFLPESEFLPIGENGYLGYRALDPRYYGEVPTICLAVWPFFDNGEIDGFHIVLLSSNPSLLTVFGRQFD